MRGPTREDEVLTKWLVVLLALVAMFTVCDRHGFGSEKKGDKANEVRLVVRPSTVMWRYEPFRVTLTAYIKNYDGTYVAYCVGWGDGSKSCRDIYEDTDYWSDSIEHVYRGCAPEIPIVVVFGKINEDGDELKAAAKYETKVRVPGCG